MDAKPSHLRKRLARSAKNQANDLAYEEVNIRRYEKVTFLTRQYLLTFSDSSGLTFDQEWSISKGSFPGVVSNIVVV